jgi:hypothetical protein
VQALLKATEPRRLDAVVTIVGISAFPGRMSYMDTKEPSRGVSLPVVLQELLNPDNQDRRGRVVVKQQKTWCEATTVYFRVCISS